MKVWADFFDYVSPSVPGATPELMTLHIRNAAIEFFSETRVVDLDYSITTVVGQADYDASPADPEYTPIMPNSVFYEAREIRAESEDRLNKTIMGWKTTSGSPIAYIFSAPFDIRFYPVPDEVIEIDISMAVKPSRTSTGVEDAVFDRYVEVISAGAVAKIASLPQKPFTNPQVAAKAAMDFANGKHSAKTEVYKSFNRSNSRVKLRKKY